jgi:hypothetical protein
MKIKKYVVKNYKYKINIYLNVFLNKVYIFKIKMHEILHISIISRATKPYLKNITNGSKTKFVGPVLSRSPGHQKIDLNFQAGHKNEQCSNIYSRLELNGNNR